MQVTKTRHPRDCRKFKESKKKKRKKMDTIGLSELLNESSKLHCFCINIGLRDCINYKVKYVYISYISEAG